ncbi:flagellar motor protein MotB [Thiomicrospira sp. ALE5]|uniref:flagellar motor protein MotB n=1 Tax=Thiomicrospira sp. ALE5 TaxID=748650 RepID=UPI0008EBC7D5|nr:flagellar motor protein MotB [Thiomicrospira sp. ALE5]SFR59214.1 chemotaxis protein MotB [Thiomicrospira sp. ALE5]
MNKEPAVIIKRVKKAPHHGHGSSAWKVALADFMTAAMAFFLMLWILSGSSDSELKMMAEYFRDPSIISGSPHTLIESERQGRATDSIIDMGGMLDPSRSADPDLQQERDLEDMQRLKEEIENRIEASPVLQEFKNQIRLDITPNGLQIQIIDDQGRPMFGTGGDQPRAYAQTIIRELGTVLGRSSSKISITGHTDSILFGGEAVYTNWELSADRANAARRLMLQGGVQPEQVVQVVGLADTVHLDKADPYNPRNRRISIVVLNNEAISRIRSITDAPAASTIQ